MKTVLPIRVLLVDDSASALAVLKKLLARSPEIEVVGEARNGKEALELIPILNPSVVCTDLEMPVMNGLELTRAIMATCPRPVLGISSLLQEGSGSNISLLLEAGALDVHLKPRGGTDPETLQSADHLIRKIKVIAKVFPIRRRVQIFEPSRGMKHEWGGARSIRMVAIGASAGGPHALNLVLSSLPANFPTPIVCIQHIGAGFLADLQNWLGQESALKIKTAESGEAPQAGTVYFPCEGTHLVLDRSGRLLNSAGPAVNGHRPSISATFRSVSACYRAAAAGVLLTGMGEDGADGLKEIADAGGLTIAQDEQTCVVFGMPRHAIELGAAKYVLPLGRIAECLVNEICQGTGVML